MGRKILIFVVFYIIWVFASMAIFFSALSQMRDVTIPVIAFIAAMVGPWIVFWIVMNRAPRWKQSVLENGRQAPATVLAVSDTGVSFGSTEFVVNLRMKVQPSGEAPFEANIEQTVSRINIPSTGDSYLVKYDPDNKTHLILLNESDLAKGYGTRPTAVTPGVSFGADNPNLNRDANQLIQELLDSAAQKGGQVQVLDLRHPSTAGSGGKDIAQELAQLAQLHHNGDLSDAEFEAAKKKLLG